MVITQMDASIRIDILIQLGALQKVLSACRSVSEFISEEIQRQDGAAKEKCKYLTNSIKISNCSAASSSNYGHV